MHNAEPNLVHVCYTICINLCLYNLLNTTQKLCDKAILNSISISIRLEKVDVFVQPKLAKHGKVNNGNKNKHFDQKKIYKTET